jgi:hypothetical protein
MSGQGDSRSPRHPILAKAEAARKWPEPEQQRLTVLALVRQLTIPVHDENLYLWRPTPPTVAEIFTEVYGDPSGAVYWAGWLDYGDTKLLPQLLANHLVAEVAESRRKTPRPPSPERPEFRSAAESDQHWEKLARCRNLARELPEGSFREKIQAIAGHRERAHLLPVSLRGLLALEAQEEAVAAAPEQGPAPEPEQALEPVSQAEVYKYVGRTASPRYTYAGLLTRTKKHFRPRPVFDRSVKRAYKNLPAGQKRRPGESDWTLERRSASATKAPQSK